jgi:hypothetical protein
MLQIYNTGSRVMLPPGVGTNKLKEKPGITL